MRLATSAFLFIILLCCCIHAQTPQVAFVNVNVVPMDQKRILPQQTVIVKDGKIIALGPAAKIKVPKGAQRIDGTGKYLMTGLADMHVHMTPGQQDPGSDSSLLLYVANGVTTVRNMWSRSPDVLSLRREIEEGKKIGPRIFTTGPLTDGDPPYRPRARVVETTEQAEAAVQSDKREGYDALKVVDVLSPTAFRALMAAARKAGLPVYGHVPDLVALEEALALRMDSIEHFEGYRFALQRDDSPFRGKRTIKNMDYIDLSKLPKLIEATRVAGTWNCPTLVTSSIPDTFSPEEARKHAAAPYLKYLPVSVAAYWARSAQSRIDKPPSGEDLERFRKRYELNLKLIKLLSDAGAGLLIGSDAPRSFVAAGFSVHEELRYFVDAGLTPYQALRAATSGPAEFLKQQDEFGTIAVGRRADLILLEANPLQDVHNAARRVGVMVHGSWFSEAELREMLEKQALSSKKQ